MSDRRGQKYIKMCAIRENALMRSAIDHDMGSIFPMDHFEAPLTPATMTGLPTTGHISRSKGLVSSISGMVAR